MEHDANALAITYDGQTPHYSAVQGDNEEVAEYLKNHMITNIAKKDALSEDESM